VCKPRGAWRPEGVRAVGRRLTALRVVEGVELYTAAAGVSSHLPRMQQHTHHLPMAAAGCQMQRRRSIRRPGREVHTPLWTYELTHGGESSGRVACAHGKVECGVPHVVGPASVSPLLQKQAHGRFVPTSGSKVQWALLCVRLRLEWRPREAEGSVEAEKEQNCIRVASVCRVVQRRHSEAIARRHASPCLEKHAKRRDDRPRSISRWLARAAAGLRDGICAGGHVNCRPKHRVARLWVRAQPDQCLERLRQREASKHMEGRPAVGSLASV
jgi:hypothetical protein